jgi:hypothetical protein
MRYGRFGWNFPNGFISRSDESSRFQRKALPLVLSGIFWTRKWAVIGFPHGTAGDGDDRQGNGACRGDTAGLFSKRYVVRSYPQIMGYFRT